MAPTSKLSVRLLIVLGALTAGLIGSANAIEAAPAAAAAAATSPGGTSWSLLSSPAGTRPSIALVTGRIRSCMLPTDAAVVADAPDLAGATATLDIDCSFSLDPTGFSPEAPQAGSSAATQPAAAAHQPDMPAVLRVAGLDLLTCHFHHSQAAAATESADPTTESDAVYAFLLHRDASVKSDYHAVEYSMLPGSDDAGAFAVQQLLEGWAGRVQPLGCRQYSSGSTTGSSDVTAGAGGVGSDNRVQLAPSHHRKALVAGASGDAVPATAAITNTTATSNNTRSSGSGSPAAGSNSSASRDTTHATAAAGPTAMQQSATIHSGDGGSAAAATPAVAELARQTCLLSAEVGPCRASFQRWAYNPATGSCTSFVYGGCQGNANNFDSQSKCEAACGVFTGGASSNSSQSSVSSPSSANSSTGGDRSTTPSARPTLITVLPDMIVVNGTGTVPASQFAKQQQATSKADGCGQHAPVVIATAMAAVVCVALATL